jgi:hypothetical protein
MGDYSKKVDNPYFGVAFSVDKSNMFKDSLAWHSRLDVATTDDRDFQVMLALTRARKWTRGSKAVVNAHVREIIKCFGDNPRKRPF